MLLPARSEDPACWLIQCGNDKHDISVYDDVKAEAIKAWNTRTTPKLDLKKIKEVITHYIDDEDDVDKIMGYINRRV
jgi:hypothetical protein